MEKITKEFIKYGEQLRRHYEFSVQIQNSYLKLDHGKLFNEHRNAFPKSWKGEKMSFDVFDKLMSILKVKEDKLFDIVLGNHFGLILPLYREYCRTISNHCKKQLPQFISFKCENSVDDILFKNIVPDVSRLVDNKIDIAYGSFSFYRVELKYDIDKNHFILDRPCLEDHFHIYEPEFHFGAASKILEDLFWMKNGRVFDQEKDEKFNLPMCISDRYL